MRKLIALLLIFILSGCSQNTTFESLGTKEAKPLHDLSLSLSDTPPECMEEENPLYDYSLFLRDTPLLFIEYLYSNQIDIDMEKEGEFLFGTQDINDWVSKYHVIWENEMNIVYENLIAQLSEEARSHFKESQASWESMMRYHLLLWYEIFHLSKCRGTGDPAMVALQSMDIIRKRTFLLAEYYYW